MGYGTVHFCHFCCWPSPHCKCLGAYQQAPTETWSQVMEQIPGYGVAASSGGPTTPSTTTAEMPEYVTSPLGLTLPDFSNWSLPPLEIPASRGLPVASEGLPSIGRFDMIRNAVGKHARAQLVAGLWAPGQRALAPPMSAPSAPQVAPPLCQPQPSKPATPYQQAVQLPGKSTGRGVTVEPPFDRAAPMAGKTTQDRGRQQTRGPGDRGRSARCPGGAQRATSNVPSTTTSEATPPHRGSRAKGKCPDPAQLVAKFHSGRWKKDLEHVLKVYYKYNIQAPYREAEWVRVRDRFFEHFLLHKEEALAIKERSPLGFMPLIEEQFWRATRLCLHRLQDFTLWIKQGSYYHGLLVQQGHLQRCPHLVGAPLPRWPHPKPSESHQDLHKRTEALAAGSSEPSTGATTAPAQETPAEEPPATETPVAEAPASNTPHSDTPAPMETGRVGDGQSWAEQVEAGLEAEFRQDRPVKHRQSLSRKRKARPMLLFPLQDTKGRLASILRLYKHAGEQPTPRNDVAGQGIMHPHPQMLPQDARCLGNQVVCMIAEYHLTSSTWVSSSLCTVLPEAAKPLLPLIKSYMPSVAFEGTRDVRVLDRAKTL